MDLQKVGWGDMDWIAVAEDGDRCGELLDYMRICSLHRKDCAPWN
jgi:hypothetical protein